MSNLKITKLYLKGFKNYLEPKEFEFNDLVVISGDNAQGKTSIGEAIAWAFLGTDLIGNERVTTRLINSKAKITEVTLEIEADDGKHILNRIKKGSANEIYLDDQKVSNSELTKFYTTKDIFLTVFNPSYFPAMTPKNAKGFLTEIMKEIDKEECLNELGDFLKDKLVENGFLRNTLTFISNQRSELKELQEDNIYLEGIIDGQSKLDIPEPKLFDDTELNNLKNELENYSKAPINEKLVKLQNELNKVVIESQRIPYERPQLISIAYLESEKTNLLKEYQDYKNQYDSLEVKTITCSKCGNEIDINDLERQRLSKIMQDIIAKGKSKAAEIKVAKVNNGKLESEYLEKVNEYKLKKNKEIEETKTNISILEDKQVEKNKVMEARKQEIKERISKLENEKNEILAFNMNIESLQKQQFEILKKIKDSKEKLNDNELKIKEINLLIDAAKQFNSIKLKKQTEFIDNYLNKVKLQFEKLTKDGELKDDFKITYEGREFNALSNAERIKAGLEISNLVMNVLDLRLPIFIDNAESITDIPKIDTQVIISKVVEGMELQIA